MSEHSYNDCDCVPGHRCDCWDYRDETTLQAFEAGHFLHIHDEAKLRDGLQRLADNTSDWWVKQEVVKLLASPEAEP